MEHIQILQTQLINIGRGIIEAIPQIILALLIIGLTFLFAKMVKLAMRKIPGKAHLRKSLKNLLILLTSIGVRTFGIMLAALVAFPNLTPTKLLAAFGIGSVAIGFAFKDVFENFLSGIIILLRREMRIGDFISCEGIEGKVEEISIHDQLRYSHRSLPILPSASK